MFPSALVQHDEMLQEHGPDRTKKGENESEEEVNSFGLLQKNFASLGNVFSDLSNSISMMHESMVHLSMTLDHDACVYDAVCILHVSLILNP